MGAFGGAQRRGLDGTVAGGAGRAAAGAGIFQTAAGAARAAAVAGRRLAGRFEPVTIAAVVAADAQHDVLVRNEAVAPVFASLPPVARHLGVQRQVVALLETQLALRSRRKIKLGHRLQRFRFCRQQ